MKRVGIVVLMALTLGAAAASAAGPPERGYAQLRHFVCQRALDPASRAVSTTAVMHSLHGTAKLSLRFQLLTRTKSGGAWRLVKGHDLNAWITPYDSMLGQLPGDVWILNKPVVNLAAPATYRFRVFFRWTSAQNVVTVIRDSPTCFQPERRPDLLVQSIDVRPTSDPAVAVYTATIANRGMTAAGAFDVVFTPGGSAATATQARILPGLPAHAATSVSFRAPLCAPGAPPTVTADPDHQVDDYTRANNAKTAVCRLAVAAYARQRP